MQEAVIQNKEHLKAIETAEEVKRVMGSDWFTVLEMRKRMYNTYPNQPLRKPEHLSWSEARQVITDIFDYGLVEQLIADGKPKPDTFKIRLDQEHREAFLEKKKEDAETLAAIYQLRIFEVQVLFKPAAEVKPNSTVIPDDKKAIKNAAPKKAAPKKAIKATPKSKK